MYRSQLASTSVHQRFTLCPPHTQPSPPLRRIANLLTKKPGRTNDPTMPNHQISAHQRLSAVPFHRYRQNRTLVDQRLPSLCSLRCLLFKSPFQKPPKPTPTMPNSQISAHSVYQRFPFTDTGKTELLLTNDSRPSAPFVASCSNPLSRSRQNRPPRCPTPKSAPISVHQRFPFTDTGKTELLLTNDSRPSAPFVASCSKSVSRSRQNRPPRCPTPKSAPISGSLSPIPAKPNAC